MKCGIVTVYNSENCGSFLQAWALAEAVKGIGYTASCVHHAFGDHGSSKRKYAGKLLRAVIRFRFSKAKAFAQRRKIFRRVQQEYLTVEDPKDIDCYILGSDTVWNLADSFFRNHRDFFWGLEFGDAKVISYAASLGETTREHLEQYGRVCEALENLAAIGVREESGRSLLLPYCGKPIRVVCDPTILLDRSEYDRIAKPTKLENFLFLYSYEKLSREYVAEIRAFAAARGLKIVTFGNGNPWCDINMAYDPQLFLSLMDKADYVLTNTFHGTVFSVIYEKRLAVLQNRKPKVLDFLQMCAMADKMTEKPEDTGSILTSEFRYDAVREILAKERHAGLEFLRDALEARE